RATAAFDATVVVVVFHLNIDKVAKLVILGRTALEVIDPIFDLAETVAGRGQVFDYSRSESRRHALPPSVLGFAVSCLDDGEGADFEAFGLGLALGAVDEPALRLFG